MSWEHFDIRKRGICPLQDVRTGEIFNVPYLMGKISTGKQRVFWGHQIIIQMPENAIAGKVKGWTESYLEALRECNTQLFAVDLRLLVAGNGPSYNESAMSSGAGFGYVGGRKSGLHIMSSWPVTQQVNQPDLIETGG